MLSGLALAGIASAGSLYGIRPIFGGYQLAKINAATAGVEILGTISLPDAMVVNEMTYHPKRQRFVVTATITTSSSYFLEIDPITLGYYAVGHNIPASYVEGVEYIPSLQSLVVSYGMNDGTKSVARLNDDYQVIGTGTLSLPDLDMDTIYTDQSGSVYKFDSTHLVDGYPFGRLDNPFTAISHVTIGGDYGTTAFDHDVAYNPDDGRLYLTRTSSLATLNAARTTAIPIGSYGGFDITALAYGPEVVEVSGALFLGDTVPTFAQPRFMVMSLKQGTNTVGSGSVVASQSGTIFSVPVLDNVTGPATLTVNGSSFLKRSVPVTLTGGNVLLGNVSMTNGDCDYSGEVDAGDIDMAIANFGNTFPGPNGNTHADVNCSGEVDAEDIDIVIARFGSVDD